MVGIAFDHRKARVARLHDSRNPLVDRLGDVEHEHLRARHHQIAGTQFRYLKHALDHRQRVGVEQVTVMGFGQDLQQIVPVFGLAQDERRQAFQKGLGGRCGQRAPARRFSHCDGRRTRMPPCCETRREDTGAAPAP